MSVILLLLAMLLPVCHLHSPMDQSTPGRCTICISLHAALPVGVHVPALTAPRISTERVMIAEVQSYGSFAPVFAASRAPPLPNC